MLSQIVVFSALLIVFSHTIANCQQEIPPKLVCYYTNWAKDRPDPWAYVSNFTIKMQ